MANRNAWNRGNASYGNPYSMSAVSHAPAPERRNYGGGGPVYGGGAYREERRVETFRGPSKPAPVPRKRSRSPVRPGFEQQRPVSRRPSDHPTFHPRYEVVVPNQVFQEKEAAVPDLKRRFLKMYVPSDFFHTDYRWQDSFIASQPFRLGNACDFHIFNKDVDAIESFQTDPTSADPADANYSYSAKVMLLSSNDLATLYQSSIRVAEEEVSAAAKKMSWLKQLHFLVGTRGKSEVMAIGGPWSPSLDGDNPAEDPQVLINTAIRACRGQTGIDLSQCTRWYKFLELHYFRPAERVHASRKTAQDTDPQEADATADNDTEVSSESRVETVVMFLPDIYNCMPTSENWQNLCTTYKELLTSKLEPPSAPEQPEANGEVAPVDSMVEETVTTEQPAEEDEATPTEQVQTENRVTQPTKLDPPNMKVAELRAELEARGLDSKGLKSQLIAKLESALKEEEKKDKKDKDLEAAVAKHEDGTKEDAAIEAPAVPVVLTEKDKRRLERLYKMDSSKPSIIVHPSRTARSGKFDCEKLSLSTLLDYRLDDQKEHTFEVSLFVEQFRDMILRDCAFNIYKALVVAPETTGNQENGDKKDEDELSSKRRRIDDPEADEKGLKEKRTVDSNLLFSFTVFDAGFSGYIKTPDVEGILFSLGLNLSRSQTRKLVQKVVGSKDSFNYRLLTDKEVGPNDEQELSHLNAILDDVDYLEELAMGNRVFISEGQHDSPSVILYTGDTAKVVERLERSESIRQKVECEFSEKREELVRVRKELNETRDLETAARQETKRLRDQLFGDREKLKEKRLLNRTYNRLLVMTNDHITRATSEIKKQFEKEENDKKALIEKEKVKEEENTVKEETKLVDKPENVTVLDSA